MLEESRLLRQAFRKKGASWLLEQKRYVVQIQSQGSRIGQVGHELANAERGSHTQNDAWVPGF